MAQMAEEKASESVASEPAPSVSEQSTEPVPNQPLQISTSEQKLPGWYIPFILILLPVLTGSIHYKPDKSWVNDPK